MQPVRPCVGVACGAAASHSHRAAFVGLEMAECDSAQTPGRYDAAQGVG